MKKRIATVILATCFSGCAVQAVEPGPKVISGGEAAVAANPNLLRNASFELPAIFNGTPMRQGTEFIRSVLAQQGKCRQLPVEGWWQNDTATASVMLEQTQAPSGTAALAVNPPAGKNVAVFSAPEIPLPAGTATLSAWVRTTGAHAKLELEFVPAGLKPSDIPHSLARQPLALPETTATWTRVQLTATVPAHAAAVAWITVDSGKV
ncbi:MAG: hypothetical protein WCI73_19800, partial [Phycisphaerae bacterium]